MCTPNGNGDPFNPILECEEFVRGEAVKASLRTKLRLKPGQKRLS